MNTRTWPYGTTRAAKVVDQTRGTVVQAVEDDCRELHLLVRGANDPSAKVGDRGTLTFTRGGLTGGYWKFVKE